ncbi:putative fimbrial protein SthD [Serratia proteamaculans]|uniref:fimbrial protein n=1 Tax=Serratia proteamaculans TaxID=28151 RepID=UPI0021833EB6|nr:fimbrial protein [Serratia proteamaculans]CAI2500537.1 putative fimbrial protein SthD [Serratia proteamaculans]
MNTIGAGLVAGVLLITLAFQANATDVTITINGRVVAHPCTVSTPTATVDLGNLYTTNLATAGSVSAWLPVTLNLTNCPVGTSMVTATFSGTADATGNYYANQGSAGNIALQLEDNGGASLPNGSTKTVSVDNTSQAANFVLQVRAITPSGNATQGNIQSLINVTYTYS